MSLNELILWVILTALELILIYPIISRLIKSQWFTTSQYKRSQNTSRKLKEKDTFLN